MNYDLTLLLYMHNYYSYEHNMSQYTDKAILQNTGRVYIHPP